MHIQPPLRFDLMLRIRWQPNQNFSCSIPNVNNNNNNYERRKRRSNYHMLVRLNAFISVKIFLSFSFSVCLCFCYSFVNVFLVTNLHRKPNLFLFDCNEFYGFFSIFSFHPVSHLVPLKQSRWDTSVEEFTILIFVFVCVRVSVI